MACPGSTQAAWPGLGHADRLGPPWVSPGSAWPALGPPWVGLARSGLALGPPWVGLACMYLSFRCSNLPNTMQDTALASTFCFVYSFWVQNMTSASTFAAFVSKSLQDIASASTKRCRICRQPVLFCRIWRQPAPETYWLTPYPAAEAL